MIVQKRKGTDDMRIIKYAVFNKKTNERIFTHCSLRKCEEKLAQLNNENGYEIRHKWFSI